MYIYDQPTWPNFTCRREALIGRLAELRYRQGRLAGRMDGRADELREDASRETLHRDVVASREIAGEEAPQRGDDKGLAAVLQDAGRNASQPLTGARLCEWQAALFPGASDAPGAINVGRWRDDRNGPLQLVSGGPGPERVRFQAPPAGRIAGEVGAFLGWFNGDVNEDPVIKAGVAHLWFVTIHPFDDGNGRIARAVTDLALARSDPEGHRFFSLSTALRDQREAYYDQLEQAQSGPLDITPWLEWFLERLSAAIDDAPRALAPVLSSAPAGPSLNGRQRVVLKRLRDGLPGKLTSSSYAAITGCSHDTALRDLQELMAAGVVVRRAAGGRSTNYALAAAATARASASKRG